MLRFKMLFSWFLNAGLSSASPVPLTPVMSRGRRPSGPGERYTPKMLPSLRKSLGMEAFPDILLFRSETSYTGRLSDTTAAYAWLDIGVITLHSSWCQIVYNENEDAPVVFCLKCMMMSCRLLNRLPFMKLLSTSRSTRLESLSPLGQPCEEWGQHKPEQENTKVTIVSPNFPFTFCSIRAYSHREIQTKFTDVFVRVKTMD